MLRWRCTCCASKHCPARVPANPVLKTDHNLPKCLLPRCPITNMSVTKMSSYRNVLLPKCPVTEMSCNQNVCYQNVHYHTVLYQNVWIPLGGRLRAGGCYVCCTNEKIHRGYFDRQQVTFHPRVVHCTCPDTHELNYKSYTVVWDDQGHNIIAVYVLIKALLSFAKRHLPQIDEADYLTDSPSSQYRNHQA